MLVLTFFWGSGSEISAQMVDEARMEAQRQAMTELPDLDGEWRGTGRMHTPDGRTREIVQTERVATLLDGTVRIIDGRSYDADGETVFHVVSVLTYDPDTEQFTMRSYTGGRRGDFDLRTTADGFEWEIPAGPATIRYRSEVADGRWHQMGHYLPADGEPMEILETNLERIGDTGWPAAGTVGPDD